MILNKNLNQKLFLTFPACFLIPIIFSNLNSNCSNSLDMRNLQEQVKKAFCYQKLFWPFTVWINCPSDLKNFANSRPSAFDFQKFFSITKTIFSHCRSEQFLFVISSSPFPSFMYFERTGKTARLGWHFIQWVESEPFTEEKAIKQSSFFKWNQRS